MGGKLKPAGSAMPDWLSQDWWEIYGDPQLDNWVALATEGSPSIHLAKARAAAVEAAAGVVGSARFPSLGANVSLTRERFTENEFIPPPYAGNWAWENIVTADLSYDLDLWGKNRSLYQGALDSVQLANVETQEVKLQIETAVVRMYLRLAFQFALKDIAEDTLKQREQMLSISKKRLRAGLGNQLEAREAEARIPEIRIELKKIEETISILKTELAAVAGKGPGDGEGIKRPIIKLDSVINVPDSLPADFIGRRPDVVAARWKIEASSKYIDAAKASFYPNINLRAFAGWQSLDFSRLFSMSSLIAGFGPAVSLPIFEGGKLRSQLRVSVAEYDIAVESYNSTIVSALEKISNQLVSLQSLEQQRTEADKSLLIAIRSYDIALKEYRAGLTDLLHLLEADSRVLAARREKTVVEAAFLDTYATLMQSIGGGILVSLPPNLGVAGK